jgi:3-oxoacyl-[acyl-carrier protein] reductase
VLLNERNALIYGAGGSIGRAVAAALASEGATVYLAGRTLGKLEDVAAEIRRSGGAAEVAELDALDEEAVDEHADAVAATAGSIDISLNVISVGESFGTPLAESSLADFERPVHAAVRSTFLTARAAARHMIRQRSGVILMFGGYGRPPSDFHLGGFQVGLSAVDALRRQLAAELGPHGIRVLTIQSTGIGDSLAGRTLTGRAPTFEDVGNVAAFAASDRARAMTATALNITGGDEVD